MRRVHVTQRAKIFFGVCILHEKEVVQFSGVSEKVEGGSQSSKEDTLLEKSGFFDSKPKVDEVENFECPGVQNPPKSRFSTTSSLRIKRVHVTQRAEIFLGCVSSMKKK